MVLILDDRVDVWGNIDNLINVNPFFFFREEKNKLNYVHEKFLKDDGDLSLYSITLLLNFIHHAYFSYYEKYGSVCDVRTIKKEKLKLIFKDLQAAYVEDPYLNLLKTYEFHTMNSFGSILENQIQKNTNAIITEFVGYHGNFIS